MSTLNWIGKEAVVNYCRQVPHHLLRRDKKLSVGDPGSRNLLVQGDNLLALKALLPYHAGQAKCIHIEARSKGLCTFRLATKKNVRNVVLDAVCRGAR